MEILVADDDLASVKLTSFLLEDAGYRVIKAYDAAGVLHAIEQRTPDLVLLDVGMPKVSGFDICRQIRRMSDVPIIFVTGSGQLQDRVTGLQIGGDDYLVKPFEPAELLARVEAVLRRRNSDMVNPVTRISQGPLTLDPIEHTVLFEDGRHVVLTPIEFRLLYYLMQNSGRVLSPDQILNKVWGYDYEGESNLVAVYVRRLRAKIESDGESPRHIITVRNLGYKFVA
ncbi:response regulator transcription factor [Roseiflexus castenholzii]|jgi:DNA-binding response OmpR family regulator|uniref:Two component transcriptional regulator, winged helix family n=1 Tax=Roseiflexus castenholzii (strain DSM 13941 / HLO8) TaxID=383372 RepID=A7NQ64_ROSCS|nr:response regulator transcription factor [Roseiflexus castenholzii]ABU59710.1 two component transcriptional regulator, winged helix family [Roseiflexus castenholzii DSM 13941]